MAMNIETLIAAGDELASAKPFKNVIAGHMEHVKTTPRSSQWTGGHVADMTCL